MQSVRERGFFMRRARRNAQGLRDRKAPNQKESDEHFLAEEPATRRFSDARRLAVPCESDAPDQRWDAGGSSGTSIRDRSAGAPASSHATTSSSGTLALTQQIDCNSGN